jgi:hypothetical protein
MNKYLDLEEAPVSQQSVWLILIIRLYVMSRAEHATEANI